MRRRRRRRRESRDKGKATSWRFRLYFSLSLIIPLMRGDLSRGSEEEGFWLMCTHPPIRATSPNYYFSILASSFFDLSLNITIKQERSVKSHLCIYSTINKTMI
jgi:hypothetical protein